MRRRRSCNAMRHMNMTNPDCTRCQAAFDPLLVERCPPAEAEWVETHLAVCSSCARELAELHALRDALRGMAVPPLRSDFADAALAAAAAAARPAAPAPAARPRRPSALPAWRRFELWAGAALGAVAAAALMVAVLGLPQRGAVPLEDATGLRVALYEPREIALAIDADEAIPGAIVTLLLAGGIDLVGFGERREISWQTDLDAGTNLLSLPIIAHSLEEGLLTALVQHDGATQRFEVRVRVDKPAATHRK